MVDSLRLTRAQIVKAVGNDPPTVRAFERLVLGSVAVRLASGDTTLSAADRLLVMTGAGSVTLPRASDVVGQMFTVKRTAGAVTIVTTNSETIDGAASHAIALVNESATVISTGAAWVIV